jgi:uncharacterized protein involved in type VI secretion and phage assembly
MTSEGGPMFLVMEDGRNVLERATGAVLSAGELAEVIAYHDERAVDARTELEQAARMAREAREAFRELVHGEGGFERLDDGRLVVVRPDRRTPRRVNAERADERRELLLDLGLGEMVHTYKPPNVSALDSAGDELRALGVDPAELIVPAGRAPGAVEVVRATPTSGNLARDVPSPPPA